MLTTTEPYMKDFQGIFSTRGVTVFNSLIVFYGFNA